MAMQLADMEWQPGEKILIYGIGNPGRQDDGLGVRLVEMLERDCLPGLITLEANYQLNVEDALLTSEYASVLFVDASVEAQCPAPFSLRRLEPARESAFTSHAMSPGAVLALCADLYGKKPRAFLCALPGYSWEVNEELSPGALTNLEGAYRSLSGALECMKFPS
jgi:hydrogenase maturation protease